MKLNVLVPEVESCAVTRCGYNVDESCRARAITVGDGEHPACDTFLPRDDHARGPGHAGVGACKVEVCRHNRDLECSADAIRVGDHDGHADCKTFAR